MLDSGGHFPLELRILLFVDVVHVLIPLGLELLLILGEVALVKLGGRVVVLPAIVQIIVSLVVALMRFQLAPILESVRQNRLP